MSVNVCVYVMQLVVSLHTYTHTHTHTYASAHPVGVGEEGEVGIRMRREARMLLAFRRARCLPLWGT